MRPSVMNLAVQAALQYIGEQWAYAQWMAEYKAKQAA